MSGNNAKDISGDIVGFLMIVAGAVVLSGMFSMMFMDEHVEKQCELRGYEYGGAGPYGIDAYCKSFDPYAYIPWSIAKETPIPKECQTEDHDGRILMLPCAK